MLSLLLACGQGCGPVHPDSVDSRGDTHDTSQGCDRARFEGAPVAWGLPPGVPGAFGDLVDPTTDSPNWVLLDLDGDGTQELVLTALTGLEGVGTQRWLVYDNAGDGFTADARALDLPDGFSQDAFAWFQDLSTLAPNWQLLDLTGDGVLDVVVTAYPGLDAVGDTHWLVFAGGADGFSDTGRVFALPPGLGDDAFRFGVDLDPELPAWELLDLDGDRVPELVVTQVEDAPVVAWSVFTATQGGFVDSAAPWPLPPGPAHAWTRTHDVVDDAWAWSLVDLDGDGLLDVVVTADPDEPELGRTRWRVHHGVQGAFDSGWRSWGLPPQSEPVFARVPDPALDDRLNFSLVDLTGDGVRDLVVHTDVAEAEVGVSHWRLHPHVQDGYSQMGFPVALPEVFPEGTLHTAASMGPDTAFGLTDVDGDGRPDLVATRIEGAAMQGLGTEHWAVFTNRCW